MSEMHLLKSPTMRAIKSERFLSFDITSSDLHKQSKNIHGFGNSSPNSKLHAAFAMARNNWPANFQVSPSQQIKWSKKKKKPT